MADQWHYRMLGEEFGPVPEETLRDLIADGTLGALDDVRRDGESEWIKAQTLASASAAESPSIPDEAAVGDELEAMLAGAASTSRPAAASSSASGDGMDLDSLLAPSTPHTGRKAEASDWYYRVGGRRFGPVNFDTLFERAAAGEFTRYDEIKAPGDSDWVEAQTLVGLFPAEDVDLDSLIADEKPMPAASATKKKKVKELWYYRVLNQEMGPVDFDGLFDLVVEGNLRPDDDIREQREAEWRRAESLVGLFPDEMLESAQAAEPADETSEVDEGDAEWYLQRNGQAAGPVTFGRLVDMAGKGQLQRTDEIRLTKLGAWMQADSMVGLFPEEAPPVEAPKAEQAKPAKPVSNVPDRPAGDADDWAAAVLSEPSDEPAPPKPQYNVQPGYAPSQPAGSPGMGAAAAGMGAAPSKPVFRPPPKSSRSSSGGGLSLPSGFGGMVGDPKVLIGVAAAVLIAILYFAPLGLGTLFQASSSDLIAQLSDIWDQTKKLYDEKADDAKWKSLESSVGPKLKEIAQTATDRGAGPSNPGLQIAQLLASKHIPGILSKKNDSSETAVRTVDNFLTRAKEL